MFVAQGATFTFASNNGSFVFKLTRLSVEAPTAEIVDMTPGGANLKDIILVPTGDWRGGSFSVDLLLEPTSPNLQSLVGSVGQATFASPNLTVTRRVILESTNVEASVGDLVRGSLTFRLTDYTGT
jgi:hypothetical protein